jgi:uncharacterized protein (DUF2126 family)
MKEAMVQILATTKGEFDQEIADLKKLIVDWDARYNLAEVQKSVDESFEQIAKAKAEVEAQAAAHQTRLTQLQESLILREQKVGEREKDAARRELEVGNAADALARDRKEWTENREVMVKDLERKLTDAEATLLELNNRTAEISKREANVKAAAALVN